MKYTVVFVCYLSRRKQQYQHAFIFKTGKNVRIADDLEFPSDEERLAKEIHSYLIDVEFFATKEKALKNAKIFCPEECIHEIK